MIQGHALAQHRQRQPGWTNLIDRRAGSNWARHRGLGRGRSVQVRQWRRCVAADLRSCGAASIGDVKINQTNPDIIWVGTGESGPQPAAWGDGVYKSTDSAFKNVGLKDSFNIGRIILHPGIRTSCGWRPSAISTARSAAEAYSRPPTAAPRGSSRLEGLPNDPQTGAIDMVIDPRRQRSYASRSGSIRYPWRLNSGPTAASSRHERRPQLDQRRRPCRPATWARSDWPSRERTRRS